MKRINYILILFSVVAMVSCMDKYTEFYTANSPVYLSYDSLRSAVKSVNPTELNNPGKIYFKDNFLFVVEKLKGIHVFDMTVPSSPQNLKFIPVPGCVDIAIKNNSYGKSLFQPNRASESEGSMNPKLPKERKC